MPLACLICMATLGNGARTIGTGITPEPPLMAEPGYFLFGESLAGEINASCVVVLGAPFRRTAVPRAGTMVPRTLATMTLASVWFCQGVAAAQAGFLGPPAPERSPGRERGRRKNLRYPSRNGVRRRLPKKANPQFLSVVACKQDRLDLQTEGF